MTTLTVPVAGGSLYAHRWPGEGPTVLAVHGITATHVAWLAVASQARGVALLAPDLRGRGRSAKLPGPYGMAAHVADLVTLLDAQECDTAVVAGHSMGAFVAVALAARHPARVSRLLLVDGGLPLGPPDGDPSDGDPSDDDPSDGDIDALLGPAAARLARTFPTREAYRQFWRAHPAMSRIWGPVVEAYVDYDLVGEPPEMHSSCRPEAMRADGAALHDRAATAAELRHVRAPISFLRAERGMLDEPVPLYPQEALTPWLRKFPAIRPTTVPDTNHYSILLGTAGASAVAHALREALAA